MKRTRVVLGAWAVVSAGCSLEVPSTAVDSAVEDHPDIVVPDDRADVIDAMDVTDVADVRDVMDSGDVMDVADVRDVSDVPDAAEAPCGNVGQTCCPSSMCTAGLTCQTGMCVDLRCTNPGETRCGSACINTTRDPAHCGTCDTVCSVTNGTPSCTGGVCGIAACATGFGDCDTMASNGCETSTETRTNCGRCGNVCGDANTMSARCETGACALVCVSGFRDCDTMSANGCEVNTATDTANCGACGTRCAAGAHATATCTLGSCGLTCETGFGNCNGNAADGCESNTATDAMNCGACGAPCAAGTTCVGGSCSQPRNCSQVHTMMPAAASGVYMVDPDGDGTEPSVQVYCDMTYMGGGWTLAYLRNSVGITNYPQFLHNYFQVNQIRVTPESAASSTSAIAGWINLNTFPFTDFYMAAYGPSSAVDRSAVIPHTALRIPFGRDGYYLYNASGYFWCGGSSAFVDGGMGEYMHVAGSRWANCKDARRDGGATGDGWDFSMTNDTPRAGFTTCGTGTSGGCDNLTMNGAFRVAPYRFYGTAGVAQAVWVR